MGEAVVLWLRDVVLWLSAVVKVMVLWLKTWVSNQGTKLEYIQLFYLYLVRVLLTLIIIQSLVSIYVLPSLR